MKFRTQKEAKEIIQQSIDTNVKAVYRALVLIYAKQTASEQATLQTHEDNKMGFSAFDAEILSSFAQQVKQRGWLTERQIELARKKIRRYWKQLAQMSGGLAA